MLTSETSDTGTDPEFHAIEFSGSGRQYFGIWLVNILLSIATLGIYSAWAKVRRLTYFKNNTRIDGYGFGYHATPGQILKGRIIAFVLLVVLSVATTFFPLALIFVIPVFLFAMPWLLNSSMRFSARMTSYRNIRFMWHGTYWKSFWWFVVAPVVGILSLGTLTPLFSKHYYRYFATHHSYGLSRFDAEPTTRSYYLAFLVGAIIPTVAIAGVIFTIVLAISFNQPLYESPLESPVREESVLIAAVFLGWTLLYAGIFSMAFIYRVLCRNLMVRTLTLSDVAEFNSTINPIRFIWISLTNLAAIIVSIGLLLPWAQVRMYRYLAKCTKVRIIGDMDKFGDEARAAKSAFGEEFAEFEGIEVTI